MRVDFQAASLDLVLLKALAEPVCRLSADIVDQALHLLGRQRSLDLALRYAPELRDISAFSFSISSHDREGQPSSVPCLR